MSDGAVPKITDFFALLSLQGGEVPAFSQLQCLLALNDLTVTWPILPLGHSPQFPSSKCRYSRHSEHFQRLTPWAERIRTDQDSATG
jgi:hypothetical protein